MAGLSSSSYILAHPAFVVASSDPNAGTLVSSYIVLLVQVPLALAAMAGSSFLVGLFCWRMAHWVLTTLGQRTPEALYCWIIASGMFFFPSLIFLGSMGAGLCIYFGNWAPLAMALTIPVAVVIGAAVPGLVLTLPTLLVIGALQTLLRGTKCPLGGRPAAS